MVKSEVFTVRGCVEALVFLAGLNLLMTGLGCTTLTVGWEEETSDDKGSRIEEIL